MMKRNILPLIAAMMLVSTASPYAHHGMRDYRDDRIETVEGTLVKFDVRNPHSIVYVDSRDQRGNAGHWTIEWLASVQLNRQGVTAETLKVGDQAPDFELPGHRGDEKFRLSDSRGKKNVVIVFYPLDWTPV